MLTRILLEKDIIRLPRQMELVLDSFLQTPASLVKDIKAISPMRDREGNESRYLRIKRLFDTED